MEDFPGGSALDPRGTMLKPIVHGAVARAPPPPPPPPNPAPLWTSLASNPHLPCDWSAPPPPPPPLVHLKEQGTWSWLNYFPVSPVPWILRQAMDNLRQP